MWTFPPAFTAQQPLAELAGTSANLACQRVQQQALLQRCLLDLLQHPGAEAADQASRALRDCVGGVMALPFDLARVQHAAGVCAGVLPRSLLESTRFEQQMVTMERLTLGPLARSL
jgi:hypothetical protein